MFEKVVDFPKITGATGATGPTGPTGPSGPTGTENVLSGLQVQLQGSSSGTVGNDSNVLFDTIINAPTSGIAYNSGTGTFTVSEAGNYYISWWVNADGAQMQTTVEFGIEITAGGTGTISAASYSPITSIQLNGNALISVTTIPTEFVLTNNSGATVQYGLSSIQANLTIIQLS